MKPILVVGHNRSISKITYNYTGDILFSCCKGGGLNAWSTEDGVLLCRYKPKLNETVIGSALADIDVTFDGDRLLAAGASGVFIFDVLSGKQLHSLMSNSVCRTAVWNKKPNDQRKFVVVRANLLKETSAIFVFTIMEEYCEYINTSLEIQDFDSPCSGASWGPYDETLLSWHEDGSLCLWNARSGEKIAMANHFKDVVTCVDFSADRSICLCCSLDKTMKLLITNTLEVIQEYSTDRPLSACSLSPLWQSEDPTKRKSHILAGGGQNIQEVTTTKAQEGKVETLLIHLLSRQILGMISGNFSPITTISFSPSGDGFSVGAFEGNIRIYKFDPSYWTDTQLQ